MPERLSIAFVSGCELDELGSLETSGYKLHLGVGETRGLRSGAPGRKEEIGIKFLIIR